MVIIRTTFGDIQLELDAEKAPQTVANFLQSRASIPARSARHMRTLPHTQSLS